MDILCLDTIDILYTQLTSYIHNGNPMFGLNGHPMVKWENSGGLYTAFKRPLYGLYMAIIRPLYGFLIVPGCTVYLYPTTLTVIVVQYIHPSPV